MRLFVHPSRAHDSWISRQRILNPVTQEWCCGTNECGIVMPVPVATAAGWAIHGEEIIDVDGLRVRVDEIVPYREAMPSPDGYFWRCHSTVNLDYGVTNDAAFLVDGERRCFFAPPQSL
jgi:hypothetical protein